MWRCDVSLHDELILHLLKKRNQVERIYHSTSFRPAAMAGGKEKKEQSPVHRKSRVLNDSRQKASTIVCSSSIQITPRDLIRHTQK